MSRRVSLLSLILVSVGLLVGCGSSSSLSDGGPVAGSSGGGGAGGSGGGAACARATAVDRSCSVDADCVAVQHVTSCCGGIAWIGVRTSALQQFMSLEMQCQASYPGCGCFDGRDGADDGSRIASNASAGVLCQGGTCKTYSLACGHACATGSACQTCTDLSTGAMNSACAPECTSDSSCTVSSTPRCNRGVSIGLCAPAASPCDMPN